MNVQLTYTIVFAMLSVRTSFTDIPSQQPNDMDFDCYSLEPINGLKEQIVNKGYFHVDIEHSKLDVDLGYIPGVAYQVRVHSINQTRFREIYGFAAQVSLLEQPHKTSGKLFLSDFRYLEKCKYNNVIISLNNTLRQELLFNWVAGRLGKKCVNIRIVLLLGENKWLKVNQSICERTDCVHYFNESSGIFNSTLIVRNSNNFYCTIIIEVPPSNKLYLQFQHFTFGEMINGSCIGSVRVITNGPEHSTSGENFCGHKSGIMLKHLSYNSTTNILILKIHFGSEKESFSHFFKAIYYSLDSEKGCNILKTALQGSISTVNYPKYYFPNLKCNILIKLPKNYRIIFTIQQLSIPRISQYGSCLNDFVSVKIRVKREELFKRICGNLTHYTTKELTFESFDSTLEINFISDFSVEGIGFYGEYHGISSCNNRTVSDNNGSITSVYYPHNYLNKQFCDITLQAPIGNYFVLKFSLLDIESINGSLTKCSEDYVQIYNADMFYQRCGNWTGREHELQFISKGNNLIIRFVSDDSGTSTGFRATFYAINNSNGHLCAFEWLGFGSHCYKFHSIPLSWINAEDMCQNEGGHLITIFDENISRFLDIILTFSTDCLSPLSYWTGGNDREYESNYVWTSGHPFNYTDWFPGWKRHGFYNFQPSDDGLSDQDCIEIRTCFSFPVKEVGLTDHFYWNDRNCDVRLPFICQKLKPGITLPTLPVPNCNKTLRLSNNHNPAEITSPFYPNSYPNSKECVITILAPSNTSIVIQFGAFILEDHDK